ncbi:MAG: inorganic triphosphatase [Hyphomicrobiales bacterium]|nr:inorganic triphosphatase [Hyphomicrobiales bacterium]
MRDRETELKFQISPEAISRLETHPLLAAALEVEENLLHSVYFDTPQFKLRQAGLVWRIRSIGDRRVQTVKATAGGGIGRHEWECDISDDVPDPSCITPSPANALLRKKGLTEKLAPVFITEVDRRSWNVERGGSLIEISLDLGRIVAGKQSLPVSEVEFELKQGAVRDLFALAREMANDVPLTLDLLPKSAIGYRLAAGKMGPEPELPEPGLRPDMPLVDGFRSLCNACMKHLMLNEPILVATRDPEALHQTRTAIRRLRAVLRVFARLVKDESLPGLRDELKWLSRVLGSARDLDVMSDDFRSHNKTQHLSIAMAAKRTRAYASVMEAVGSQRYRNLLLDFCAWLECAPWTTQPLRPKSQGAFQDICLREIGRWDRKIIERGAGLSKLDAQERHAIRIDAKSFYYIGVLTQSLMPRSSRKSHAAYLKALKDFQTTLGNLNDAHVAQEAARALTVPNGDAAERVLAKAAKHAATRHARKERKLVDDALETYGAFAKAPRAWPSR